MIIAIFNGRTQEKDRCHREPYQIPLYENCASCNVGYKREYNDLLSFSNITFRKCVEDECYVPESTIRDAHDSNYYGLVAGLPIVFIELAALIFFACKNWEP